MGGNGELDYQWEPVGYEELAWRVDHDALEGVPKSRRRKITGTYRAAVPFELRDKDVLIPAELQSRMEEVAFLLVRFDAQQEARGYDLPALLLRSESSASSQIENMTSSVRNVALAELSSDVAQNARIIAGNVAAMRAALGAAAEPYIEQRGAKWHVDLKGINAHWLRADGVEQIDVCAHCTACRPDLYWSHRRMGNARGAQIAMIALR